MHGKAATASRAVSASRALMERLLPEAANIFSSEKIHDGPGSLPARIGLAKARMTKPRQRASKCDLDGIASQKSIVSIFSRSRILRYNGVPFRSSLYGRNESSAFSSLKPAVRCSSFGDLSLDGSFDTC
jgi:hypothetical protein